MELFIEICGLLMGAGIIGLLFKKVGDYFASKIKNEYWRGVVSRIDDAALKAVKLVYQAYVGPIKKAGKSLNDQEKLISKEMAKQELKAYIGAKGVKEALELFGVSAAQLDKIFEANIESHVYDEKVWNEQPHLKNKPENK